MLLSRRQKRLVAQAAAAAWAVCPEREGYLDANPGLSASAVADAWRRVQQGEVLGLPRQSLREATQADFPALMAHFLALREQWCPAPQPVDTPAPSERWAARAATDGGRRALYVLRRELASAGLAEEYAAAICRRQYRCGLAEASERQIWRLVFTVRNRGRAKRRDAQHTPYGHCQGIACHSKASSPRRDFVNRGVHGGAG